MTCVEIKDKKYQTRKSPPYHAADCKGMIKQGKDMFYISSPDKRGIYKWTPAGQEGKAKHLAKTQKVKGATTYMIHDNYSVPFIVDVFAEKATIYKATNSDDKAFEKAGVFKELNYKKIWIGDNLLRTKGYDPKGKWKGNSILMDVGGGKYVYVGRWAMEFSLQPGDSIVEYYSPVGNNDSPYPYILGKDFVYFMWEAGKNGKPAYAPASVFDIKKDATDQLLTEVDVTLKSLKYKKL